MQAAADPRKGRVRLPLRAPIRWQLELDAGGTWRRVDRE
jgi:hypothetical protein